MKFLHQCYGLKSNRITDRQTKLKIYITPYQGWSNNRKLHTTIHSELITHGHTLYTNTQNT